MHRPQSFSQFWKVSMNHLTIYYDGHCSLCCRIRNWLSTEPQIVQLRFIDRWSNRTQSPFAGQVTQFAGDDLVAVADDGRVWWGDDAWLMVLYALDDFRAWSFRLADPGYRPFLRQMVHLLSKHRIGLGRWMDRSVPSFNWLTDQARLLPSGDPGCSLPRRLIERGCLVGQETKQDDQA